MRNSKGVSLIALIITIIVIIILAAIVMNSAGDTTSKAQLAVFQSNFSGYAETVEIQKLNIKQTLGVRDLTVNDQQLNYMVANGLTTPSGDTEVMNRTLPVGYVMPATIRKIYTVNVPTQVVAYVIDDYNIPGYNKGTNKADGSSMYEFYGDSNGDEYHFITSNGHVFTIPGYGLACEDGTIQFYISNEKGCYYVAKGNSTLAVGDRNVNGDKVDEDDPLLGVDFMTSPAGDNTGLFGKTSLNRYITNYGNITGDQIKDANSQPLFTAATTLNVAGRNTVIGGPTHYSEAYAGDLTGLTAAQ